MLDSPRASMHARNLTLVVPSSASAAKGFDLVSYPNTHKVFKIEEEGDSCYAIRCHNGNFLSAHVNGQ